MRAISCLTLIFSGCVYYPSSPMDASVFEHSDAAIEAAAEAGKLCQLVPNAAPHNFPPNPCLGYNIPYDHKSCVAFDEAIQAAARPLSACSNEELLNESAELEAKCDAYLQDFMTPCVGLHAYLLAQEDWARSVAYREAVAAGVSEERAAEKYLSDVVRYRQPMQ